MITNHFDQKFAEIFGGNNTQPKKAIGVGMVELTKYSFYIEQEEGFTPFVEEAKDKQGDWYKVSEADAALAERDSTIAELQAEVGRLKEAIEFACSPDMWQEEGELLDYLYTDWYVDVLQAALEGGTQ